MTKSKRIIICNILSLLFFIYIIYLNLIL